MRGEYIIIEFHQQGKVGSPPHAWRILFRCFFIDPVAQITSTCVENTGKVGFKIYSYQDHLHMRGEYMLDLSHHR